MDNSRKINYQKKKRTWENVKLSDVIRILAAEHGLVPDVEEIGEIKPIISQGDVTDIRFILDAVKAESEEYYVRVTLNKLTVKKEKIDEPSTTELWYRQYPYDIFSFSPRVNKENKPKTTAKSDISNVSGKTETGTANNDTQRPVSGNYTPTKGDSIQRAFTTAEKAVSKSSSGSGGGGGFSGGGGGGGGGSSYGGR